MTIGSALTSAGVNLPSRQIVASGDSVPPVATKPATKGDSLAQVFRQSREALLLAGGAAAIVLITLALVALMVRKLDRRRALPAALVRLDTARTSSGRAPDGRNVRPAAPSVPGRPQLAGASGPGASGSGAARPAVAAPGRNPRQRPPVKVPGQPTTARPVIAPAAAVTEKLVSGKSGGKVGAGKSGAGKSGAGKGAPKSTAAERLASLSRRFGTARTGAQPPAAPQTAVPPVIPATAASTGPAASGQSSDVAETSVISASADTVSLSASDLLAASDTSAVTTPIVTPAASVIDEAPTVTVTTASDLVAPHHGGPGQGSWDRGRPDHRGPARPARGHLDRSRERRRCGRR